MWAGVLGWGCACVEKSAGPTIGDRRRDASLVGRCRRGSPYQRVWGGADGQGFRRPAAKRSGAARRRQRIGRAPSGRPRQAAFDVHSAVRDWARGCFGQPLSGLERGRRCNLRWQPPGRARAALAFRWLSAEPNSILEAAAHLVEARLWRNALKTHGAGMNFWGCAKVGVASMFDGLGRPPDAVPDLWRPPGLAARRRDRLHRCGRRGFPTPVPWCL